MIDMIVAYSENLVIGHHGQIPWGRLSEDLRHFRDFTLGSTLIMGRKTWDSLGRRELPGRRCLVVSRSGMSLQEALEAAGEKAFVIGGGEVYRQCLSLGVVREVVASEVRGEWEGDCFFPDLSETGWKRVIMKEFDAFRVVKWVIG